MREIDAQKSAQIGWTDGVICNFLGFTAEEDPASVIVLFPADRKAREFNLEKFEPMVEATPALQSILTTKSRAKENTHTFKSFPGGFMKFVGSNSPSNLKSTSAKRLIVEEPDDCNLNIKGQGDSITLLAERGKGFADSKLIAGGTPTIAGVSSIEQRMELSDKRRWYVPCHHCGEAGLLRWENVKYEQDPAANHPVFGSWIPASARYACPGCGALWNDAEKNRNVRRAYEMQREGAQGVGWVPTAPFNGVAGFYFNELMSPFEKSKLARLIEKYLIAKHALETEGDVTKMIAFWNATLGLPWEYKANVPELERLAERAEDYPEWMIPWGGLVLTVGVDVQHNRLAVKVKAWGRGEESWLIWAGELYGNVLQDAVWDELDRTAIFRVYKHVSGADLTISAVSVDSSDGQTSDAVYRYVRRTNRKFGAARAMAIKGSTSDKAEIFRAPAAPLDVNAQHKAAKHGLRPYMAGVSRAKDLILGADENAGRLNLQDPDGKTGRGAQRMHFYRGTRSDYFEQLASEVKAPARNQPRGKKVWQKKAGKRNEFLDCEVYALHAARALRIDTWPEIRWSALEEAILQANLFAPKQEAPPEPALDAVSGPEPVDPVDPESSEAELAVQTSGPGILPAIQAVPTPQRPIRRMRHRGVE